MGTLGIGMLKEAWFGALEAFRADQCLPQGLPNMSPWPALCLPLAQRIQGSSLLSTLTDCPEGPSEENMSDWPSVARKTENTHLVHFQDTQLHPPLSKVTLI